ncbi:MAG: hypothetical protein JWP27_2670 [Flaviaesturariibacter sp.]|nr:hypothetical protein [Flaviaesturariibacter sp.]
MNLFHLATFSLLLLGASSAPALLQSESSKAPAEESLILTKPVKEESAESIPWSARRILTWEDFQGEPKRNTDAVASTSTSLGIAYQLRNGQLTYEVTCTFSKPKSWGATRTAYILAHEQAHFDITELYARKLNQKLQQYQFNRKTYKQDLNAIYQSVVSEKEAMQQAYDNETDHSRRRRIQNEWLDRVEQLLVDSQAYATYP